MALADQLSIDRLRAGARNAASRSGAALARRGIHRGRRLDRIGAATRLTPAAWLGFGLIALPWLVTLAARTADPDLGRGRIATDPWSLLAPAWGAWALAGLLVAGVFALIAWARFRLPAPDLSRTIAVAVLSLLGFTIWCAASVWLWSPSPNGAWRWTVVALGATIAAILGLFAGAQAEGRRGLVLGVLVTGALTAVIGVVDLLAFPDGARRIVSPFDPSATAMLIGLAVLVALGLDQSEHPQRRRWLRAIATLGIIALFLGASRSAILATVLGLLVLTVRGVPVAWPLLQSLGGALPAVVIGLLPGGVVRAGTPPDSTGRLLTAALVVFGVAIVAWLAARDLGAPAPLRRWSGDRRVQGASVLVLIGLVVGGFALGQGGIQGTWERTTDAFKADSEPGKPSDASRLWSGTSDSHLWRWQAALDGYQQSGDAFLGLGPGSGAQTLRVYRRQATPTLTTPSAPIAVLTEAGAVGLALVLVGLLGLSLAARSEQRRKAHSDGALLLTIGTVILVHSLFNDTFYQPLLLFPAIAAVAALASRQSVEQMLGPPTQLDAPPPVRRTLASAAGMLLAIVLGLGAVVPARAQLKAREAEADLIPGNSGALRDAALYSSQSARLDPLNFQGDAVGSQAALALQRWTEARRLALAAVRKAPGEAAAWRALAYVALAEHDRPGARTAARKLQALDPAAPTTLEIAIAATLDSAPPEGSPTASATPLTAQGG